MGPKAELLHEDVRFSQPPRQAFHAVEPLRTVPYIPSYEVQFLMHNHKIRLILKNEKFYLILCSRFLKMRNTEPRGKTVYNSLLDYFLTVGNTVQS